jgi:hypothetical protein
VAVIAAFTGLPAASSRVRKAERQRRGGRHEGRRCRASCGRRDGSRQSSAVRHACRCRDRWGEANDGSDGSTVKSDKVA